MPPEHLFIPTVEQKGCTSGWDPGGPRIELRGGLLIAYIQNIHGYFQSTR